MAITRILVPIDFSKDSLNALAYASDLAKRVGAELLLLHVVEPVYVADPCVAASPGIEIMLNEQWQIAKTELARIGANLKEHGLHVRAVVKRGTPAQVIVNIAKRERRDLIVMSTHGRTGLAHMFIGSVAEKVVRTASCPVLSVRRAAMPEKPPKRVARHRS